jgi:hypothetical protein
MSSLSSASKTRPVRGSLDGDGAADHDQPYRFGFRPRASAPYPFNTRQYARLLVFRGRIQDQPRMTPLADPDQDAGRDMPAQLMNRQSGRE